MRSHRWKFSLALVSLVMAAQGCADDSGPGGSDAGDHCADIASTDGVFCASFVADPEPPAAGADTVYTVTLTYADTEEPVIGADVTVMPWMQMGAHGHSTQVPPVVEEIGDGVYSVTIRYTMAGLWENTFDIAVGELVDEFVLDEDVY